MFAVCETVPAKKLPHLHNLGDQGRQARSSSSILQQPLQQQLQQQEHDKDGCTDSNQEHCQYDEDGDPFLCIKYPKKVCPSDVAKSVLEPQTECKQIERRVCGPETCPVEERDFLCTKQMKTVRY
jgi:hypothetical protein